MLNTRNLIDKISVTKNLISDQTWGHISKKWNVSGTAFDVSDGVGSTDETNTALFINAGGFDDQKVIADLKFVAPTVAGGEEVGVLLRCSSLENPGNSYYYARVDAGVAKITRVLEGSFSTLTSSAFALAQDTIVTITFSIVGTALSATFDAGGSPATVNLATTDDQVPSGGIMGFRSGGSTIYCSAITFEQL